MAQIDFRVDDWWAVGHDRWSHIIFRRKRCPKGNGLTWKGENWDAKLLVRQSKAELISNLKAFGAKGVDKCEALKALPEKLR